MGVISQTFSTAGINNIKIINLINKLSNMMGYRSVLLICASHCFRKRKQAGNTLMMSVDIPNTHPAVQDAPRKSNL